MFSGGTSAQVPGQHKTHRDPGNSGHEMELYSGGDL